MKNRTNEASKIAERKPPARFAPIRKDHVHPRTGRVCLGLDENEIPQWGAVDPEWLAARPARRRTLRPSALPTSYVASGKQQGVTR